MFPEETCPVCLVWRAPAAPHASSKRGRDELPPKGGSSGQVTTAKPSIGRMTTNGGPWRPAARPDYRIDIFQQLPFCSYPIQSKASWQSHGAIFFRQSPQPPGRGKAAYERSSPPGESQLCFPMRAQSQSMKRSHPLRDRFSKQTACFHQFPPAVRSVFYVSIILCAYGNRGTSEHGTGTSPEATQDCGSFRGCDHDWRAGCGGSRNRQGACRPESARAKGSVRRDRFPLARSLEPASLYRVMPSSWPHSIPVSATALLHRGFARSCFFHQQNPLARVSRDQECSR
jgi:hypothetical protein